MNEKIIKFGPEKNMLGIVSLPDSSASTDQLADTPAILLLNSGLIHKVGPYRMSVDLARKLASAGYVVFRFDLPGIGDSTAYKTTDGYKERTVNEISSAMDVITKRYGKNNFISIGLCTGAMNSHVIASSDIRVQGAVMLDAYAYPTAKFLVRRYAGKLHRIFHPEIILRVFNRLFNKADHSHQSGVEEGIDYWQQPPKNEIQNDLATMMSRDARLLYIYSGGVKEIYNYEKQFEETFSSVDFKNNLTVRYLEKMDHTYTLQNDRDDMLGIIEQWVMSNYPG